MKSIIGILLKNSFMEEQVVQKSWFKRNWMWFVPTLGCGTLIILGIFGIGALFFGVTKMISGSTPAQYAVEQASQNERVIELLGTLIEQKGMTTGSINFKNGSGDADLQIPIQGPKGKAVIYIVGEKFADTWTYSRLLVKIKGSQERINLLEKVLEGT